MTTDTSTAALLIAARAIISDPAMWHQGDWSSSGEWGGDGPCCAEAAIYRAADDQNTPSYQCVVSMRYHTPNNQRIDIFNDLKTTTHADILAVFDRAIAATTVQP
jgi:hypothetical protein